MKTAKVVIKFGPKRNETGQEIMAFDVNGVWEEGGKALGDLDKLQALALIEKAKHALLASVDMKPPALLTVVPAIDGLKN